MTMKSCEREGQTLRPSPIGDEPDRRPPPGLTRLPPLACWTRLGGDALQSCRPRGSPVFARPRGGRMIHLRLRLETAVGCVVFATRNPWSEV